MTSRPCAIDLGAGVVRHRFADLLSMTKPRLLLMVVLTTVMGFHLGWQGPLELLRSLQALLWTTLAAAGALALNEFIERDLDALMIRTRARPLPDGRLDPSVALCFGTLLVLGGITGLLLFANGLAAILLALAVGSYLCIYTPLKRRTACCTLVGAIPGALPPVIGWTAARGELSVEAGVLGAILFLWQLPHALAIGMVYREDYRRAGIRILPVLDQTGRATGRWIIACCLALLAVGLLPVVLGVAGWTYGLGAVLLGLLLLGCGRTVGGPRPLEGARRLLLVSLLYLPLLFGLMALDRVRF